MNSIEVTEKILSSINMGKTASVVYGHMSPVLNGLREAILASMLGDYRTGQLDATKTQSKIAQLVVLEDLETRLRAQINKGENALKKTQGD